MTILQKLDDMSDFLFAYRFKGKTGHWQRFKVFQKDFFLGGVLKPQLPKQEKPKADEDDFPAHDDIGGKLVLGIALTTALSIGLSLLFAKDRPPYQYEDEGGKITVYPETSQVVRISPDNSFTAANFEANTICKGVLLKSSDKDLILGIPSMCDAFNRSAADQKDIETLRVFLASGQQRYGVYQSKK